MAEWDVIADRYYDYTKGTPLKVHVKAVRRMDVEAKPLVFVRLAFPDEFGRYVDSHRSAFPAEAEGLRAIARALEQFAAVLEKKKAKR
jgi:hypothetical protein